MNARERALNNKVRPNRPRRVGTVTRRAYRLQTCRWTYTAITQRAIIALTAFIITFRAE